MAGNTPIPIEEVDLGTRRLRLFHITWLNRERLDLQLKPLINEIDTSTDNSKTFVWMRAIIRGAITLFHHLTKVDIREHPSAIFILLIKMIDDKTFDAIWEDYEPLINWVANYSPSHTVLPGVVLQSNSASERADAHCGDEGFGQDILQQDIVIKNNRAAPHSDTG